MIIGVGLDAVRVDRIRRALQRSPDRFSSRVFTAFEIAQCREGACPEGHFAHRFAIKEAVFKALATGWGKGGRWLDIETRRLQADGSRNAIELRLSGRARAVAAELGVVRSHVAISGGRSYAMALVLLEGSSA